VTVRAPLLVRSMLPVPVPQARLLTVVSSGSAGAATPVPALSIRPRAVTLLAGPLPSRMAAEADRLTVLATAVMTPAVRLPPRARRRALGAGPGGGILWGWEVAPGAVQGSHAPRGRAPE